MAFVTDSNRPQSLLQPPPTACLTASGASPEVLSLLTHPWGRGGVVQQLRTAVVTVLCTGGPVPAGGAFSRRDLPLGHALPGPRSQHSQNSTARRRRVAAHVGMALGHRTNAYHPETYRSDAQAKTFALTLGHMMRFPDPDVALAPNVRLKLRGAGHLRAIPRCFNGVRSMDALLDRAPPLPPPPSPKDAHVRTPGSTKPAHSFQPPPPQFGGRIWPNLPNWSAELFGF